jgi:hypothetical protein
MSNSDAIVGACASTLAQDSRALETKGHPQNLGLAARRPEPCREGLA